jgi:hypothetical protein
MEDDSYYNFYRVERSRGPHGIFIEFYSMSNSQLILMRGREELIPAGHCDRDGL